MTIKNEIATLSAIAVLIILCSDRKEGFQEFNAKPSIQIAVGQNDSLVLLTIA